MVAVDAPQFVELNLGPRIGSKGEQDIYRARIGSIELPVTSVTNVNQTIRVRFEVPEAIRRRAGEELVFLCFVKTALPLDLDSHRILYSVKWR